jgi:hypothetical protein
VHNRVRPFGIIMAPSAASPLCGAMPFSTPCVRCEKIGLVRTEREITGKTLTVLYYCGACQHTWNIVQDDPRRSMLNATLRPVKDRRKG